MLATASMSVMTPPGLAIDSMKIALVFGDTARSNERDVVGIGPHHVPAEILERVVELVDRAAIELAARRRTRRPASSGSETPAPARRGRRRPRARRCRLRARRRAPPAPRWSGCRCGCRCCRRPAGRTARRRDRRRRTRTTWSDRSASRARRWSDRAARRHGWQAWQSRACVRSWPVPRAASVGCGVSNHRGASRQRAAVALIRNRRPQIAGLREKSVLSARAARQRVDS